MYTRQPDVIYGRKYGMALTLEVFTPGVNVRGVGIVAVISGGWYSSQAAIADYQLALIDPLLERGYTVFAVVTSSQPKFTIPEIVADVHRAVRFVRYNAAAYGIDATRLGICGSSAGGHLSLLVGFTGGGGDPLAEDAVDRESSRVQAVAEFYAPTDFFNYGQAGVVALGQETLKDYRAPFDFHEFDGEAGQFLPVSTQRRWEIGKEISPITHVTEQSPPVFMVHGDADLLVPLQQSEILAERLADCGVPHQLQVKAGGEHGWDERVLDVELFADWFDLHLA